ncbi:dioxygenase [Curvibacter sp. HBC61]|uniref:Dioxygenase n=1 Tax=Curvibacter cyanobacteriorum TaxID=3026422 RepID=A0ABT5N3K7_9BURK|nr:dioxygenase [Curvibacter sp. HBC61]MDD0840882.1 dioxygenase [Curvibacter sp. HBC61]
MSEMNLQALLQRVNSTQIAPGNPRVRALTERIVTDLFKTIDELDVSADEFWTAVDWLGRLGAAGQLGLITAGLGFDRLLDIRADEADQRAGRQGGTPRAIEGPLYVAGAPTATYEVRVDEGAPKGEVFVMEGQVRDLQGQPVPGALIDVWHANEQGGYSHFFPGMQPYELRRRIQADAQGRYRLRSYLPPGYSIPPNSPTSELFEALGRHGHRPAHIHFLVVAPGLRTLTTQVNIPGDTYIDDDFAFATRDGLVIELERGVAPAGYESLGIEAPFVRSRFDFVLTPALNDSEASPLARIARITA